MKQLVLFLWSKLPHPQHREEIASVSLHQRAWLCVLGVGPWVSEKVEGNLVSSTNNKLVAFKQLTRCSSFHNLEFSRIASKIHSDFSLATGNVVVFFFVFTWSCWYLVFNASFLFAMVGASKWSASAKSWAWALTTSIFSWNKIRVNLMRMDASGILSSFFFFMRCIKSSFSNIISDQRKAEVLHATPAKTNVSQLTVKIT